MPQKDAHSEVAVGLPEVVEARMVTVSDILRLFAGVVNADGSIKPQGIKALFERYQVDIRAFAKEMGVTDSYIHGIIARRKRDRRIEDAIAARFGIAPDRLWGRRQSIA